ncbi:hypothetical protein ACFPN2_22480 [Steroidobacter flavus]|uniref:Uncharacterized protein n=1 Tax=Steroidobacter flavus TaxID=1842136 RepID=A0ABV8SYP5_9GAMM
MLRVVQIGLFVIAGIGFLILSVAFEIYRREGGVPTRPHFEVQRTPRERQLGKWYRAGSLIFGGAVGVLLLIDIALRYA